MRYLEIRYRLFAWLALAVWFATLFMRIQSGGEAAYGTIGFSALIFGWLVHPAWLANLGFLISLCLLGQRRVPARRLSIAFAFATASLALSIFTWDKAIDRVQAAQIKGVEFGIGVYVWVSIICLTSLVLCMRSLNIRYDLPSVASTRAS
jgi:hypothetical protein